MPAPDVEALIQAAGQGTRLGLGPKAFVTLEGRTLLERVVTTMAAVAARVIVAVPEADMERANRLVAAPTISVIAGGERRSDTFRRLVAASTAPWLLLNDSAHPFVSIELARKVLTAARRAGCAAAAVPNVDFVYDTHGVMRAKPNELMIVQKPVAFQRSAITAGLDLAGRTGSSEDLGVLEILARAGVKAAFVPGHPINQKITTAEDFFLAQAFAAFDKPENT
jgi:2-C-methyl-D-erythritol 4-phosphate cytidylyltransferase